MNRNILRRITAGALSVALLFSFGCGKKEEDDGTPKRSSNPYIAACQDYISQLETDKFSLSFDESMEDSTISVVYSEDGDKREFVTNYKDLTVDISQIDGSTYFRSDYGEDGENLMMKTDEEIFDELYNFDTLDFSEVSFLDAENCTIDESQLDKIVVTSYVKADKDTEEVSDSDTDSSSELDAAPESEEEIKYIFELTRDEEGQMTVNGFTRESEGSSSEFMKIIGEVDITVPEWAESAEETDATSMIDKSSAVFLGIVMDINGFTYEIEE